MTQANMKIRRAIMDVLPISRSAALTAQDIAEYLNIETFHVTACLRGLYMSHVVNRRMEFDSSLNLRNHFGIPKHIKVKKNHYWKVET